jgi:hypothetical protein
MRTANPTGVSKNTGLKIAGHMTDWDKEYLRQMAEQAKRRGDQKELDRLNKQYSKYGMSFGKLPGA